MKRPAYFSEICENCGLDFGSHHGGSTEKYPYSLCPGHAGRMDWDNSPGTVFKASGKFAEEGEIPYGTRAKNLDNYGW